MSITGANNPFPCTPVVFSAANQIIQLGTITRLGNVFTFSVGFVWKINGVTYQNTAPIALTIAEATDGFYRIDNAILNTSNSIELQQGLESETIALQPVVPDTNILLTSWNISGSTIGDTSDPIIGSTFKKKSENLGYGDPDLSGTNAVIQLRPDGTSYYAFSNASLVSIDGFGLSLITGVPTAETPYPMKDLFIENTGTTPIVLLHDGPGTASSKFFFTDEENLTIPAGGKLWLKYGNPYCQLFFKSWSGETILIKDFLVASASTENWRFRNFESGTSYTPTVLNSGTTNFETALTGSGTASIPYQTYSSFVAPYDMKLVSITVAKTDVWAGETFSLGFGTHLKTDASNVVTDGNSILEVTLTKGSYTALKKKYTATDFGTVIIPSGHSMLVGWIGLGRGVGIIFELEKV
jgi:hypothetical protein